MTPREPLGQAAATLLVVLAHPDDEAFTVGGTLTHYARRGVRVVLACATRGEAGKLTEPGMTSEELGRKREQELRQACRALEIEEPIFLGFHDSGRNERVRRDDPLALMNADMLDVEAKIRDLIASVRPTVMLTFDPHGWYGHVDHLQIHRAATAAFQSAGFQAGGGPRRLFYTALSLKGAKALSVMGQDLDPETFGISEDSVAVTMNVAAYAENKRAALAAHGTQMGEQSPLGRMNPDDRQALESELIERELFTLGGTRTPLPQFPLRGFFSGLPGLEHLDD